MPIPSRAQAPLAAGLAGLVLLACLLALRMGGFVEPLELALFDRYLRALGQADQPDARVLIVQITEADIGRYEHPISDRRLATALQRLGAVEPRAIGIDLYRDLPVVPGTRQLFRTLRAEERVVAVEKFGEIPGPRALRGTDRIGFNDLPLDPDQTVRRGLLFQDDGEHIGTSFSLRLATLYLAADGIVPTGDPERPEWFRLGNTTLVPLEADHGGYAQADAGGYQFLMDCRHGSSGFETVTFGQLLEDAQIAERARDRVVLIGQSSESARDYERIPCGADGATLATGVEIHAHLVSQLVRNALGESTPVRTLRERYENLLIALAIAAGIGVVLALRQPQLLVPVVFAGVVLLIGGGALAFRSGVWVPMAAPALGWTAAAGLTLAWAANRERTQRGVLMQLFSSYVAPEVAEELWRRRGEVLEEGRFRPQRLVATVLYLDMRGYSARAHEMEPETLVEWVNDFMEPMARLVGEHHGVVDDYFGDGLKANFGVPFVRETDDEIREDARRAVRCALAIERVLHQVNEQQAARGLPTVGLRVGVHTGVLVAASVGSENKLKYTTVGEAAIIPQRLESFDQRAHDYEREPVRILVSEATYERLGHDVKTEDLGEFVLPGQQSPLRVYRVLPE